MMYKEGSLGLIRVLNSADGTIISSRSYNSLSYWTNEATRNLLIKSDGSAAYFLGERIVTGTSICYDMQLFKFSPPLTTEAAPVWALTLDSCFPQAILFDDS
jgi:hypothetical protein